MNNGGIFNLFYHDISGSDDHSNLQLEDGDYLRIYVED